MGKVVYYLTPSSFCFGVKRSIDELDAILHRHVGEPIYCVHAIVHNPKVTQHFEDAGVRFVESLDEIQDSDSVVVFSAHGINRVVLDAAKQKFKAVYNLECPFVTKIYTEVDMFLERGITKFFYIGKGHHQEGKNIVEYILSKGAQVYVFQDKKDIPVLAFDEEFAVLSQTTLNYLYVSDILKTIKNTYVNAHIPLLSDVCKATTERQEVILQHINAFDTFVVIGGRESNNTRELYEIGLRHNKLSFSGESLDDILSAGEEKLLSQERVAITGGASTPVEDIQAVFEFFKERGYEPKVLSL